MANLIDDLRKLGDTLSPSELPHGRELDKILASLVKSLEHEGLKVAGELFPKPEVDQAAAAAEQTASDATTALEALIARAEAAADKLAAAASASPAPPSSTAPAADTPVVPAPPSWPPSGTPPADPPAEGSHAGAQS